jgi:beta-lactamase regulating signal transducer with metallopeptidase domain/Tfp pilus assembly protein PilF
VTTHLIASTAAALLLICGAYALRHGTAAWRHTLLLVALLRFAVPTGWLAEAGRAIAPLAPADSSSLPLLRDLGKMLAPPAGPQRPARSAPLTLFIWMAGTAAVVVLWARRWPRCVEAVRLPDEAEVEALRAARERMRYRNEVSLAITPRGCTPAAAGILRPRVLLPEDLSGDLSTEELEAVLAHELAHLQRADNLIAAVAHAVTAVFWFHPLVWWIELRMLAERENACDETVLRSGAARHVYAAGILKVCRRGFAPAMVYAGFTGSDLQKRMENIMTNGTYPRISGGARAVLGGLLGIGLLIPVATGFLAAQPARPTAATQQDKDTQFRTMTQVEELMRQQRADEALALIEREIEQSPGVLSLKLALGNTAVRAGRFDLAIATFRELIGGMARDSAEAGDLYLRLGETYRRKGDLRSAVESLLRATDLLPANATVSATLALVLEGSGRTAEAMRQYEATLQLSPEDPTSLNNLAYLMAEHGGDLNRALEMARKAREIRPLAEISDTVGWILLKRGQTDQAIEAFTRGMEEAPENASIQYHLALALAAKGDVQTAGREARQALEHAQEAALAGQIREFLTRIGQ